MPKSQSKVPSIRIAFPFPNKLDSNPHPLWVCVAILGFIFCFATSRPALAAQSAQFISRCSKITSGGFYQLTSALHASSADCIDINANNVTLDLHGFNITNIGPAAGSVGINILSTSANVTIEGANDFIDGFSVGIQTSASSAEVTAEDFNVVGDSNAGALIEGTTQSFSNIFAQKATYGIEVRHCTKCTATNIQTNDNSAYGVWIVDSQSSLIYLIFAQDNGVADIYEGCSPTAPGASCQKNPFGANDSIFNNLYSGAEYGVVVDKGETKARIYQTSPGNAQDGESLFQLFDGNASCGSNTWFDNTFTHSNQACIK